MFNFDATSQILWHKINQILYSMGAAMMGKLNKSPAECNTAISAKYLAKDCKSHYLPEVSAIRCIDSHSNYMYMNGNIQVVHLKSTCSQSSYHIIRSLFVLNIITIYLSTYFYSLVSNIHVWAFNDAIFSKIHVHESFKWDYWFQRGCLYIQCVLSMRKQSQLLKQIFYEL
jgi:hypothetical protein